MQCGTHAACSISSLPMLSRSRLVASLARNQCVMQRCYLNCVQSIAPRYHGLHVSAAGQGSSLQRQPRRPAAAKPRTRRGRLAALVNQEPGTIQYYATCHPGLEEVGCFPGLGTSSDCGVRPAACKWPLLLACPHVYLQYVTM